MVHEPEVPPEHEAEAAAFKLGYADGMNHRSMHGRVNPMAGEAARRAWIAGRREALQLRRTLR